MLGSCWTSVIGTNLSQGYMCWTSCLIGLLLVPQQRLAGLRSGNLFCLSHSVGDLLLYIESLSCCLTQLLSFTSQTGVLIFFCAIFWYTLEFICSSMIETLYQKKNNIPIPFLYSMQKGARNVLQVEQEHVTKIANSFSIHLFPKHWNSLWFISYQTPVGISFFFLFFLFFPIHVALHFYKIK